MKWKSMPVFLFCTWTIGDPITCGLHLESVLGGNPWLLQIFKVKMLVLSICYSVSGGRAFGPKGFKVSWLQKHETLKLFIQNLT